MLFAAYSTKYAGCWYSLNAGAYGIRPYMLAHEPQCKSLQANSAIQQKRFAYPRNSGRMPYAPTCLRINRNANKGIQQRNTAKTLRISAQFRAYAIRPYGVAIRLLIVHNQIRVSACNKQNIILPFFGIGCNVIADASVIVQVAYDVFVIVALPYGKACLAGYCTFEPTHNGSQRFCRR